MKLASFLCLSLVLAQVPNRRGEVASEGEVVRSSSKLTLRSPSSTSWRFAKSSSTSWRFARPSSPRSSSSTSRRSARPSSTSWRSARPNYDSISLLVTGAPYPSLWLTFDLLDLFITNHPPIWIVITNLLYPHHLNILNF